MSHPTVQPMRAASMFLLAAFLSCSAQAEEETRVIPDKPDTEKTFSINWENDVFSGSDGNYTNGLRASVVSAENDVPHWLDVTADALPFFDVSGSKRWEFAIGQNIYTPDNYQTTAPQPDERPYAGWLYGTAGVFSDTGKTLDSFQITLGIVGPASGAEQVQETVHDFIGSPHPNGWQYQLENEPGIILAYQRKWRNLWQINPKGYGFDLTPSAGASIGNVLTAASAGAVARFGQDLPADYGPPLIGSSIAGTDYFAPSQDLGWYIFGGLEGNAIARDIFLDGNTFEDSPSVDKKNFVGGLQAGLAVTYHGVRYAYTHSFRTKQFDTQQGGSSFGAFTVSWKF